MKGYCCANPRCLVGTVRIIEQFTAGDVALPVGRKEWWITIPACWNEIFKSITIGVSSSTELVSFISQCYCMGTEFHLVSTLLAPDHIHGWLPGTSWVCGQVVRGVECSVVLVPWTIPTIHNLLLTFFRFCGSLCISFILWDCTLLGCSWDQKFWKAMSQLIFLVCPDRSRRLPWQ